MVRDELTTRVVDPLALSTAAGHTYLDAWCHLAQDQRLFRLDRIVAAEVLDEPVGRHARRRPRDLSDGLFRPSPEARTALLRLTAGARWVAEYYPVETVEEVGDGGLLVTLRFDDPTLAAAAGAAAGRLGHGAGARRAGPAGHSDRTAGPHATTMRARTM